MITGKNGRAGAVSHFWPILTNLGYFLSLWVAGKSFLIFFFWVIEPAFQDGNKEKIVRGLFCLSTDEIH